MSNYQTFVDRPGVSRSSEKLDGIKLPADLTGKSVLDLGCNEGFFSLEAKRRGADLSLDWIMMKRFSPALERWPRRSASTSSFYTAT